MTRIVWTLSILLIPSFALPASAKVIYVNNRTGDDVHDGTSPEVGAARAGPVRSLTRARVLIGPGDEVEIANTGDPYFDSLRLIGGRASGVASHPTVVRGNGAILDGSETIDPNDWVALGNGLWRLDPKRKGWFRLVRSSEVVTEAAHADSAGLPNPAAGSWAAWRGSIYYRALAEELPPLEPYRLATREAGIFFYGVHDVIVENLTVRHFRLDGVNAHDQTRRVLLQNVVSEKNGRSGVFVGGSSSIILQGGSTNDNREASLLIHERAKADVREVKLDTQPVVGE
ncbi:MAG: right-handed parallel beta-helix repeat-containing protein [Planctomycetota bacterium]|nr:right-handed parallel beta-helix repeat-containing protein [Planctomycetaceae bacterium]MDQ3331245.1 right-handed parallel beta-helix repeat-containing protein [Planctomycetota bacterium]